MKATPIEQFSHIADANVQQELLPMALVQGDNSMWLRQQKIALREAMDQCLTPTQRRYLEMHYWQGMSKSEIAHSLGINCSTVSRTIQAAVGAMSNYMSLYMRIVKQVSRDIYDTI